MYNQRQVCYCGKIVYTENLKAHQLSQTCRWKRAMQIRRIVKGRYPLYMCVCGMILATQQRDAHESGDIHHQLLNYRQIGYSVCQKCHIPYKGSQNSHLSSILHQKYLFRKQLLSQQNKRDKYLNLTQTKYVFKSQKHQKVSSYSDDIENE